MGRSNPSSSKTPAAGFQVSNNFRSPGTIPFAFNLAANAARQLHVQNEVLVPERASVVKSQGDARTRSSSD
jgi:hypothetical protein